MGPRGAARVGTAAMPARAAAEDADAASPVPLDRQDTCVLSQSAVLKQLAHCTSTPTGPWDLTRERGQIFLKKCGTGVKTKLDKSPVG